MAHPFAHDPVLRLLPTNVPDTFAAMEPEEQAWRGRMFLLTWVLQGQSIPYSWSIALADDPDFNRDGRAAVKMPDALIIESVQIAHEELAGEPSPEAVQGG